MDEISRDERDNNQRQALPGDSFSSSLQNLDLLDTVFADFATGKLRTCDISGPLDVSSSNDLYTERGTLCDESLEHLSDTCQTTQSALSDSFCDEIFDELEKTATFHKYSDWSSNNNNKFENFHQDTRDTKERDSR